MCDADQAEQHVRWCWACQAMKPAKAFAFRDVKRGLLQGHCGACHAVLRRAHYLKNKPDHIRRAIAQVKARRDENRRNLLRYLLSHPCVDCGEADVIVLEFDHRVPAQRSAMWAALRFGVVGAPWWRR